jgi:hypothetical protein
MMQPEFDASKPMLQSTVNESTTLPFKINLLKQNPNLRTVQLPIEAGRCQLFF